MDFGIRYWENWKSLKEALDLKGALDLTVQSWKLQVGVYNEDVKLKVIMLLTMMIVMMTTMTHFINHSMFLSVS